MAMRDSIDRHSQSKSLAHVPHWLTDELGGGRRECLVQVCSMVEFIA